MSNEEKELKTFLPNGNKYTLSNGDVLKVEPLKWGKEIKVCQLVSKFFGETNMIEAFAAIASDEEDNLEAISAMLIPLINEAPQVITQILVLLLNKDQEYIEESLTSEDVMQIFLPFLQNLFTKYTNLFQKVGLKPTLKQK